MVRAMHTNLDWFDGKFNVDRSCKRIFDLNFRDGACAAKCVECLRRGLQYAV